MQDGGHLPAYEFEKNILNFNVCIAKHRLCEIIVLAQEVVVNGFKLFT